MDREHPVISAFQAVAKRVPAYAQILAEAGISPEKVRNLDDFRRYVPVIDKKSTFGRFPVQELCVDGRLGKLGAVLTSSGHSGQFAFGVYPAGGTDAEVARLDDALDQFFQVRGKTTLLINCLSMGVKIYTQACALAETSVRADMVTALVARFGRQYEQIILAGDAAFIKHVLELGRGQGIDWSALVVHVVVGEEPIAENARRYLEWVLGGESGRPGAGIIRSSMGVAELGLNLFFEIGPLVALRRALHENESLRHAVLGPSATCVPMLFTYDPGRIFVEIVESGRLVISTLDRDRRIPLIRYASGDVAEWFVPPEQPGAAGRSAQADKLRPITEAAGIPFDAIAELPMLLVRGRGQFVTAGDAVVHPEEVKEGLYHDPLLARLITANFRLRGGPQAAGLRIQLSPGVACQDGLAERFAQATARYVQAPLEVTCEAYEAFGGGMSLDYERKFDYLEAT